MNISDYSEQYIKFVSDHFITSLTNDISKKITNNVTEIVNQFDISREINNQIGAVIANAIASYKSADLNGAAAIGQNLVTEFKNKTQSELDIIVGDIRNRVINEFQSKVNSIEIVTLIKEQCDIAVKSAIQNGALKFPDRSIPGSAVQYDGIQIKADNILPGIIKRFTSTGIEDLSSTSQITITDTYTILENKLITQDIEITGDLKLSKLDPIFADKVSDMAVAKIEKTYSDGTFDQYVHRTLLKLNEQGIDSTKVLVQGKAIVENSALAVNITSSNLRKVGLLSELEVAGDALFDDTLFITGGKVGINTLEPEYPLDFWDQEVQIIFAKKQKDTGFIGSLKNQNLIIGTGGKDHLILNSNGEILVQQISIGKTIQSSAAWQPTDNRQVGTIVWNEQPQLGQPIGWVSLGGARWAKFGTITE